MKAKLLTIMAVIVLMTGCQMEVTPVQPEGGAGTEETSAAEGSRDNADNIKDNETETAEDHKDESGSENGTEGLQKESGLEDGSETGGASLEAELDESSQGNGLFHVQPEYGGISAENFEEEALQGISLYARIQEELASKGGEAVELSGLYETYWAIEDPSVTRAVVLESLTQYFTDRTAEDMLDLWQIVEVDGRLLVPDHIGFPEFDASRISLRTADVDAGQVSRYVSMSMETSEGDTVQTVLEAVLQKNGLWKLNTVPGMGRILNVDGSVIRERVWVEDAVTWRWPEFISSKDSVLEPALAEVRQSVEGTVQQAKVTFQPEAAFERWNIPQLTQWVSWTYRSSLDAYPSVDVYVSEYIKHSIHPNHKRMTTTISRATGEAVSLDALTRDRQAFDEAVNIFIDVYMQQHQSEFYGDVFFEGITENTQFYLTPRGFMFYFQLYEYAPYSFGYPEIEVPYSEVMEALDPDFALEIKASGETDQGQ